MEFKVGDKVLVKSGKSCSSRKLADKICTIEKVYFEFCILEEEEDSILGKGGVWNEDIELYEEEFPEKWWIYPKTISEIEAVCKWFDKNHNNEEVGVFYSGQKLKTGYTNAFQKGNVYFEHKPEEATEITFDQFKKHILKESTIMKNLLETEFVIENCSLGQRAAIKHYCDEKKIKYASKYTFEDKVFDAIVWDKTEFLNSGRGRKDKRDIVTFSELIQFLDNYQPEPEFKVGDFVKLKNSTGQVTKIENDNGDITVFWATSFSSDPKDLVLATPEEIEKWKEENEIKLPRINQYDGKVDRDFIIYGNNCAKLKISWFKNIGNVDSFLNIGENRTIRSIKLNSDVEITIAHIEQIKKFIEHNKL